VDQRCRDAEDQKSSQPQDDQNDDQSPEHGNLLGLTAGADGPLAASMGPTSRLCNGRDQILRSQMAREEAAGLGPGGFFIASHRALMPTACPHHSTVMT
jgi:hypothetical protein